MKMEMSMVVILIVASQIFVLTDGPAIAAKTSSKALSSQAKSSQAVENKAISLVNQTSEVKSWLKLFTGPNKSSPATGGHPGWQIVSRKGNSVTVQVFEDTPDRTVTFGFYDVNMRTNKVTKQTD